MVIFPQFERNELSIFECPICGGLYRNNPARAGLSCAVNHGPGSCCHYSDIEVTEKELKAVRKVLGMNGRDT